MKKISLVLLTSFLMMLYIGPLILAPSSVGVPIEQNTSKDFLLASEPWLDFWDYRKAINITGSAGAGTNYQVNVTLSWIVGMENDFRDIRFTDDDKTTLLDYWLESLIEGGGGEPGYGYFWVEVKDNLDTNQTIYMYYGNDAASTTSDGHATFQEFYDKTNTTGWNLSNGMTVTTSGDFLRFYDSEGSGAHGIANRTDLVVSDEFEFMASYKTVSVSADDQGLIGIMDGADYFDVLYSPQSAHQTDWYYYDGSSQKGGDWAEGTEYIFTIKIDEGDSANGIDYRQHDTDRVLLDSALNKAFGTGSPTDTDTFQIATGTTLAELDLYMRWGAFRKCIDDEPVFDSLGEEETAPPKAWNEVGVARFIFPIGWDPVFQFGFDAFFIFAGLIMMPLSTMYIVRGGRKEASMDKLFYALIIFVVGLGLFIGGIMP